MSSIGSAAAGLERRCWQKSLQKTPSGFVLLDKHDILDLVYEV
ncbi:MAG: hypothetical protein ABSH36_17080 [Solirubrobacteraceae bacterium]